MNFKSPIKRIFAVVLVFAAVLELKAQDPQFTQFYANPLYLNPAFAGSQECPRLNLNYRNQWPAIEGTFLTYAASYDQNVDALSGGLGFSAFHDRAGEGTIQTTNISAMYSYMLPVSRNFSLRAGFQATYFQKSIDWSNLTFGDMIDPRYGFIYPTNETPGSDAVNGADFSAGLLGYTKNFYFGAAVHHLTEPNESFFESDEAVLPRKYTGHIGANIPFKKRYPEDGSISPNILYQRQGSAQQFNFGLYVRKGPIVGGLWYRLGDSFIALVGVQTDRFRFGYSYDLTTSRLTNATAGSHEISLGIQFECRPKRKKFRPLACPQF